MLLFIIYLAFISLGLPDSILGAAWPSIYHSLSVPPHFAGYLSMIIAGGTVLSSIYSAAIIRRLGTGRVTAFSTLITAAALAGFGYSRHFGWLCLCAFPLGLGAGSIDAALNNYVALHYKAKHMNWLHCSWGLGASAGPLVMSFFLARPGSWSAGYRALALMQCVLAVILFASLPFWQKSAQKTPPDDSARREKGRPAFFALLRHAGVRYILAAFFCYCALESITGLWGSSYLVMVRGVEPARAARWIALFYAGITAGRFVSGFLTIRLSNRSMIVSGQSLMACGILLLALPAGKTLLLPGFFITGLGCAPIFPCMLHITPRLFGAAWSQSIIGLEMASAYIGSALMPALFGRIAAWSSFALLPVAAGGFLIIESLAIKRLKQTARPPGPGIPQ